MAVIENIKKLSGLSYPVSAAPMMDVTNRHCRYFWRLLCDKIILYTEMVVTKAILFGDSDRLLSYSNEELPLVLQLGGDNPQELAKCAKIAQDHGFSEINLNVGCPSERVQSGNFGACLMHDPGLVAQCVLAMKESCQLPVSVKHRLGTNERNGYECLSEFVSKVGEAGCDRFTVHARVAVLGGLSPKQNREIPELDYSQVFKLKKEFSGYKIEINGGIETAEQAKELLKNDIDGVMLGRALWNNPRLLLHLDDTVFGNKATDRSICSVVEQYLSYLEEQIKQGAPLRLLLAPLMNIANGYAGAKAWRRSLTELPLAKVELNRIKEQLMGDINRIDSLMQAQAG
jgi:tRNA-dihydrouridine synthase A